ncbi:PREDICTED: probable disease resistance protein At4g27220 [Theobroma cacao]|uniref:Probable disease resistance protein At4g27220 n=1 Tax=Theobroma cacao TaxID=3641 RepID=A0AB32WPM0_THECC|nr:PREDICTED: probable disease resistance protein At4g27220 [Theobroma cacao]
MALDITRERFLVRAGKQLKKLPYKEEWGEDLEKVSLIRNSISKIPQNMQYPKCQKLTTLLLSNNSLREISESFFEYIPNLKILDLSKNLIQKLPNSISNLKKLTTLLLCDCMALENVPSLSKLQVLKKLNLAGTLMKKIPQATSRAEEMKTLNKLEVLEVCFNDMHDLSVYAAQRKRPNDYNIFLGRNLMEIGFDSVEISKSVTINCFNVKIKNSIILPSDIQGLRLRGCECNGSSFSDIIGSEGVTDLKKCTVDSCNGLESIFSSRCASLQTIEILLLEYLWNFKIIVGESMPPEPGTFSNLQSIYIRGCAKLKNLFSAKWVLQNLHNLEEIYVWGCEEMEEIIASEKEGISTDNNVMFTLPKLKKLKLSYLPELKSICRTNEVMDCDSLQQIVILDCPKLKRIPLHLPLLELDNSQPSPPPSTFPQVLR